MQEFFDRIDDIVIDTGVYIAYFEREDDNIVEILDNTIFNEDSSIITYINKLMETEIYYILCRDINRETAETTLDIIQNITRNINIDEVVETASLIKCRNGISIVDCYSIATGIYAGCPVLFKDEQEITPVVIERINEDFEVEILILSEDLIVQ